MPLTLSSELLERIRNHGERAYPEEGAGFLLGRPANPRAAVEIVPSANRGAEDARQTRYLIGPDDYVKAEQEADRRKMQVIGVFHSHPDHPDAPSAFDLEWAQPSFSYIITSIEKGKAAGSKSWLLAEDRSCFREEALDIT